MSDPYLGEIKLVSFNFSPEGWAFCDGQSLPINQNQALFAVLGTSYGGDGVTTFKLPDLQGRIPVHQGPGFVVGQSAGETAHTLTIAEMPAHTHPPQSAATATNPGGTPANSVWSNSGALMFAASPDSRMAAGAIANAGSSQPHENQAPYLALTFVIALTGVYPSSN